MATSQVYNPHRLTVQESLNQHLGKVIRVTPTVSVTAYADDDVLFLTTEIPNAVPKKGGTSRLVGVTVIDQSTQGKDLDLIYMQVSTNLIGALSPGSSGGVAISDANLEAAKIIGVHKIDFADNQSDLVTSKVSSFTAQSGTLSVLNGPIILQAEEGSTSVYFAGIAREATDLEATDDLTFAFHIEYR